MAIQPNANGEYIKTLTVKRFNPKIDNTNSISEFVRDFKDYSGTTDNKQVVFKTMNRIGLEVRHLVKTNRYSTNIRRIKDVIKTADDIPAADAFIYSSTTETNNFLNSFIPPTLLETFNTWDRIADNEYYPGGVGATGEANAWYWSNSLKSMVMPLNSAGHMGFVSDKRVDNYDFALTVRSSDIDNDMNGVILAYERVGNINEVLLVTICCDYTDAPTTPIASNIRVYVRGSVTRVIYRNDNDNINTGWNNQFKRISVRRRGDYFSLRFSRWNSTELDPALDINFDLNDRADTIKFKGPKQYGYYNHSQPDSYYSDVVYHDGFLSNIVIDASKNEVYKYRSGIGWELLSNVTAQDIYGSPRVLNNESTGESFQLNTNDTITKL